jgi:molecular chaperone GrpE
MSTQDTAAKGPQVGSDSAHQADQMTEERALATEVTELRRERDDLYDRLLRKSADFDNYRKRMDRDRRDMVDLAAQDLLLDLLPILDNFERALAADVPAGGERYRAGVELIATQLQDLLKKRGVTPIEAVGADFDPHIHQAVVQEVSSEHREGEVMAELRRGYRLGDRLLRPSMVKVAKREQA